MKEVIMKTLKTHFFIALTAIGLFFAIPSANAAVFIYNLDTTFSGSSPGGVSPWLTATFTDIVGGVELSLSSSGLINSEFVGQWYFNYTGNPADLTFNQTSPSPPAVSSIGQSTDSFKADGDGFFDILIDFEKSAANRFGAGDLVTFDITSTGAISASMFNSESVNGGGVGTFLTAAHVQGIGLDGEDSGWIGTPIPEPSTYLILGSFIALAVFLRHRKLAKKKI